MTKLQLLVLGIGVLLTAAPVPAQKPGSTPRKQPIHKVEICHHSTGKHPGTKTLRVPENDVTSHLAHGDTQGACPIH